MRMQENIAQFIRTVMEQQDKSLAEFSEELGISRNALYAYRSGSGNPTISTLERIAEKLDVDPAFLLLGVHEQEGNAPALLLLDTVQSVVELPERQRQRFTELFTEIVHLWNEE